MEGTLNRKHDWESTIRKASNRSWDKVYVVLTANILSFYKDQKQSKANPSTFFRNEPQIDVTGSTALVALDYTKRQHVFRLKQAEGGEYLFQCKNEYDLNLWISRIKTAASDDRDASPSGFVTLPPNLEGKRDEPKRRSFMTISKKKPKDA